MIKQYVEFFYPGSFVSETSIQEISDRAAPVELPERAYAYRFFSRSEVELDGEVLLGKPKEYSPMTYYGEVMTLEDVKALTPAEDYRILVSNMETNKWGRVVKTIYGQFIPFNDNDEVKTI